MNNTRVVEGVSSDVQASKDKLKELVRYASLSRLKTHTNSSEVELKELDSGFRPGRILASNLVFILVSGEAMRLTFKIHFDTRVAKYLAYRIFGGKLPEDISPKQAIDYFKEFGNLVAGRVVTLMGQINIELGISLPLSTRGFYEVYSDYSEKQYPITTYSDFWALEVNEHDIFCSAQFEILDRKPLENLIGYEIAEEGNNDDDAEMDFL